MLRQETSEQEFKMELEKMSVKEKFQSLNNDTLLPDDTAGSSQSLSTEAEREAAKSAMIYLKSEKTLDLGKLKATDYKFNKRVFLPKSDTAERESLHGVRRTTMLEIFREFSKKEKKSNDETSRIESNLSKSELAGMMSLKKRVANKEIIITETDKSRRFCVL